MSDPLDIASGIAKITPPANPPPEAPDELAKEEELDASFMAELTPQKRNIFLYE